jgi:hypothetical protein
VTSEKQFNKGDIVWRAKNERPSDSLREPEQVRVEHPWDGTILNDCVGVRKCDSSFIVERMVNLFATQEEAAACMADRCTRTAGRLMDRSDRYADRAAELRALANSEASHER